MPGTVFAKSTNNASSTVGAAGYTAGSGSLTLAVGGGSLFPSPTGGNFVRITVIQSLYAYVPNATTSVYTIYKVTARSGDVLTIDSAIEGTTDRNYLAGDIVEIRATSGSFSDVHTAVNTLENTPTVNTSLTLGDGVNVAVGTTTGSKIATSSSQKLGFYNVTPIVQQSGNLLTGIGNLGLIASPTIAESDVTNLTTDLAAKALIASPSFTGSTFTLADAQNVVVGSSSGTKIATATSQKLGFYNTTPVVQQTGNILTSLSNLGLVATPTLGGINSLCNGRLTLTSGTAFTDSATGTTIYFTPYHGNRICLYDGTTWQTFTFAEISASIPAPTGLYDVFVYNNSGSPAIAFSAAWSATGNGTGANGTRTDALATQDGVLVKSGSTGYRYVGTIYSSSGTTSNTYGTRGVFNHYNKLQHRLYNQYSGAASWTYTTANTWRGINGVSTVSLLIVTGVAENANTFMGSGAWVPADANNAGSIGIGYDVTTTSNSDISYISGYTASPARFGGMTTWNFFMNIGLHTVYLVEMTVYSAGSSASVTFYGTSGSQTTGIWGTTLC